MRTRQSLLSISIATLTLIAACGLHDDGGRRRVSYVDGKPLPVPGDTIVPPDVIDPMTQLVPGAIDGSSSVTDDGEARYSIPLWVPPGRAGVQPQLSLEYRSRGGNGPMGVGWALAGLSQINRCPRSVAVDGEARAINYDMGDDYCLDGQHLKRVADPPQQTGSTRWAFHTERDSFAQIIATMDMDKKTGPTHFTIYEKNGLIQDYDGFHILHYATMTWALTQVQDRYGNTMKISYNDVGGYLYPKQIDYTGSLTNTSLTVNRSVKLFYSDRDPQSPNTEDHEFSALGGPVELNQRLNRIEMWGPDAARANALLRAYNLTYTRSPANFRLLLAGVSVADGSGNHFGDTTFEYEAGQKGFTAYDGAIADAITGYGGFRLMDVNGDGNSDIVYMSKDANGQPELVARVWDASNYRFGDRNEFHLGADKDIFNTYHPATPLLANTSIPNSLLLWMKNPATNTTQPVVQQIETIGSGVYLGSYQTLPPNNELPFAADFDGDGLADILAATSIAGPPFQQAFEFRRNLGTRPVSFAPGVNIPLPPDWPTGLDNPFGVTMPFRAVDFFGDGRQQLPVCPQPGSAQPDMALLIANDAAYTTNVVSCSFAAAHTPMFVDVNGDGLEDVVYPDAGANGAWAMQAVINPGPRQTFAPITTTFQGERLAGAVRFMDYDQDGHPDLIATMVNATSQTAIITLTTSAAGVAFGGFDYFPGISNGNTDPYALEVGDLNGDGMQDYVTWDAPTNTFTVQLRNGNKPDMLTRVVDGHGAEAKFTYEPISSPVVYTTKPVSSVAFPLRVVTSGVWVVREESHSNGTGAGQYNNYFHTYADGLEDVSGRGFLGFNTHEIALYHTGYDIDWLRQFDNGNRPSTTYYPYVGLPTHETTTITLDGGTLLARTNVDHTYAVVSQPNYGVYFPYAQVTEANDYRDDAGTLAQTRHEKVTINTIDNFGNVQQEQVENGSTENHIINTTYNDATDTWLVNQPTSVTDVARTTNGEGMKRTRAFQYNAQGNVEWEVVEPNLDANGNISALPQPQPDGVATLFTHYVRDPDGQISTVTRDSDFTATAKQRVVNLFYDDPDRVYPTRMTNKLGHMVHVAYHPGLGVPAASLDPNGVYSRWRYDTFGRLKRAEPGQGEPQSLTYRGYTGLGATNGNNQPTLSLEVDSAGDAGDAQVTQFDLLGRRVVESSNRRNDGAATIVERQYNDQGGLAAVSRPHFDGAKKSFDSFTYDGLGRVLREVLADGRVRENRYFGARVDTYDADPAGSTTIRRTISSDLGGNIVSSVEHAAAHGTRQARDLKVTYGYGPFDVLESIVGLNGITSSTTFDRIGRALETTDPSGGEKYYGYNIFGEPETLTVNKNSDVTEIRTIQYDDLGRQKVLNDRDGTTTWTWDSALNGTGRLASVATPDVTVAMDYGNKGELAESRWTVGGETFALDHVVDGYGRPQKVIYPTVNGGRFTVRYEYGKHGSLLDVRNDNTPAQVFWTVIDSDANGAATNPSGAFPQYLLGSNITVRNVEDPSRPGFLTAIRTTTPATIQSLGYTFTDKGNLWTRHDDQSGVGETFEYDELDRLEHWTVSNASGGARLRFDYDDLGNRTGRTWETGGGTSHTYQYAQDNGAGPYGVTGIDNSNNIHYDGEGNQFSAPGRLGGFTAFGLPAGLTTNPALPPNYIFSYDGFGSRVSKTVVYHRLIGPNRTVTTLSIGGLYTRTTDSTGGPATHAYNIVAPVGTVAQVTTTTGGSENPPLYMLRDHLGSADTIVDATGKVLETRKFDPFGVRFDPNAPGGPAPPLATSIPFGFTGHEHDWDLGLINMNARVFDPQLARFLSPDRVGESPLSQGGLNRYSYVLDNPGNRTDPSGLSEVDLGEDGGGDSGGGWLPWPGPGGYPGGPTGTTLPPIPQPTPHGLPPSTGGAASAPYNAAEWDAKRIAASNAQARFTLPERFGEMLRSDPHFESFRAWSDDYDASTTIWGRVNAATSAGFWFCAGELGRESDNIFGLLGRGVQAVDPNGTAGFTLAMAGQESHMMQVAVAGSLVSGAEAALLDAAAYSRSAEVGGAAAEAVADAAPLTKGEQAALNYKNGTEWRNELAAFFEKLGYEVRMEVYKPTGFGKRFIDIEVSLDGKVVGGIEAKTGNARYGTWQELKDMWLKYFGNDGAGYIVNVVRKPK